MYNIYHVHTYVLNGATEETPQLPMSCLNGWIGIITDGLAFTTDGFDITMGLIYNGLHIRGFFMTDLGGGFTPDGIQGEIDNGWNVGNIYNGLKLRSFYTDGVDNTTDGFVITTGVFLHYNGWFRDYN